jgi:hypothetical protein
MARSRQTTGEGPQCPIVPTHGRMLVHEDWGHRYWCPAHDHGGNGRFFHQDEVADYELTEEDTMKLYESIARQVIAEEITIDDGVTTITKRTRGKSATVRDKLSTMIDGLQTEREETETKQKEAKATNAKKRTAAAKKDAKPRQRKKWVEPEKFAKLRDKHGLTNTAIAKAWGKSPSRLTELTKGTKATQGGSIDVFNDYKAVVESLAEDKED